MFATNLLNNNALQQQQNINVEEEWISLKKYSNFEISLTIPHVIRDKYTKKIVNQSINNLGYYQLSLNNETLLLHRVIAEQFLDNSNNYTDVNHKNHNKLDNRVDNLDWISHSDNLKKRKKFIKQKSEVINNLDLSNCVEIKSYAYNKLDRYYYDKVNEKIYLKKKNSNNYKVIKPTYNGNMLIITLVTADNKTITKGYNKLLLFLKENY